MNDLEQRFIGFRTGDVCLSAGENIGDIMIFIGRHSTIQHSCLLVWLDKSSLKEKKIKTQPYFIDEDTTVLSFLGLAEGSKVDMGTDELHKGLILWTPEELFSNAPIVYVRKISREHISDEHICQKMDSYIEEHHLKLQYAYGKGHIVTVGLGFDVFGKHPTGVLCSENIYMFLEHICSYPEFKVEEIVLQAKELSLQPKELTLQPKELQPKELQPKGIKTKKIKSIQHTDYKTPDAIGRMYVPDFFSAEYNTHPIFEGEEVRVIGTKNEEDITVKHPYFIVFIVIFLLILIIFFIINNYCESCSYKGFCPVGATDLFDSL
jgi:hypothetical protein